MAISQTPSLSPLYKALALSGMVATTAAISSVANADVAYEHSFSDGMGTFSGTGRIVSTSNAVRIRGGYRAGGIQSAPISVNGAESVSIQVAQSTSGLDEGESAVVSVSINGATFTPLNETGTVLGQTTYTVQHTNPIQTIALQFSLDANSFFETYTIRSVTVESLGGSDSNDNSDNDGDNDNDSDDDQNNDNTSSARVIIPDDTWTCGLPNGIPDPTTGELVFQTTMTTGQERNVGLTPYGDRRVVPVNGGNITPGTYGNTPVQGNVNDNALEFNLSLPSGALEHESRYVISASRNNLIYMRNCGVADGDNIRFVADFEAESDGPYAWLNRGSYIGVREKNGNRITLSVYANPSISRNDQVVQVEADNDLRQQTWECAATTPSGRQGREILEATVGIGGFQTVGDSKYGNRRIIPITGGSFNGDIRGSVDEGGADFQLTRNGDLSLEARYTLKANNGEWISVRNCGDFANGSLTVPMFETRMDGAYNYLNDTSYVGTITPGLSRVIITVFEER